MEEKPWYDKSNEKEPGNPRSRVPELWEGIEALGVSPLGFASLLSIRIYELLLALDRAAADQEAAARKAWEVGVRAALPIYYTVEQTEGGLRYCTGDHHRAADCEWRYLEYKAARKEGE